MKVGVISDIHANPFGLEAALNHLKSSAVDLIVCAGDLTGYSPLVNETLELLLAQPVEFILGNHDHYLLKGCPTSKNAIVQKSVYLTKQIIKPEFLKFISSLKPERLLDLDGFPVKMVHGGPTSALEEYVYPDREIDLDDLRFGSEKLLILGHTHHQMLKQFENFKVLNPGSSGQPRDGKGQACFALFDTLNDTVDLKRLTYDTSDMINSLKKEQWPPELLRYF